MSALQEFLKAQGASPELLAEADALQGGGMRQDDYTKKMQELSGQREQLSYLAGQVQQRQQGPGGAQPQSHFEQHLASLGDGESADAVRGLLEPAFKAYQEDLQAGFGQDVGQVRNAMVLMNKQRQVDDAMEKDLVSRFGEGVREKFPQIKEEINKYFAQNQTVSPEQALWAVDRDGARSLLTTAEQAQNLQSESQTIEGFGGLKPRPPAHGGGGGFVDTAPAGGGESAPAAPKTSMAGSDFEALYAEISSEVRTG